MMVQTIKFTSGESRDALGFVLAVEVRRVLHRAMKLLFSALANASMLLWLSFEAPCHQASQWL